MEFNKSCRGRCHSPFTSSPYDELNGRNGSNVAGADAAGRHSNCRNERKGYDFVMGESINSNSYNYKYRCECSDDDSVRGAQAQTCPTVPCRNSLGVTPNLALSMAYVPDQQWCDVYDCGAGFERGTIFKQLDKPFTATWRCR